MAPRVAPAGPGVRMVATAGRGAATMPAMARKGGT